MVLEKVLPGESNLKPQKQYIISLAAAPSAQQCPSLNIIYDYTYEFRSTTVNWTVMWKMVWIVSKERRGGGGQMRCGRGT